MLPEDDLMIETCRSVLNKGFRILNNIYVCVCALVGMLIKLIYEMHGATIKMTKLGVTFRNFTNSPTI